MPTTEDPTMPEALTWEKLPPFLFGRYRIEGTYPSDPEGVIINLTVKPAGAGSRVEWEVSPPEVDDVTTASGEVAITESRPEASAIEEAKAAAVASLDAWYAEQEAVRAALATAAATALDNGVWCDEVADA
jgi:hypothetical protein